MPKYWYQQRKIYQFNPTGCPQKMRHIKFCFPYISSPGDRIFKILVSTPYNTPLIIGDTYKNFEDPITWTRDIRKTKFDLLGFFMKHPLVRLQNY